MTTAAPDTDIKTAEAWLREAYRILAGESRLLPQQEHLEALAHHARGVQQTLDAISLVVAAVLVEQKQPGMTIPGDLLAHIRARKFSVSIVAMPDGSVGVQLMRDRTPQTRTH